MTRRCLFFIILAELIFSPFLFARDEGGQETIRVCVLKDVPAIKLTLDSAYRMYALKGGELLKEGKSLYKVRISADKNGLLMGKAAAGSDGIKIVPKKDASIYIDRWRFRGEVDIIMTPELKLIIVNHLGVEDYLYGVLYHEVAHWWPYEALKAQAIVARTYALYQKNIMRDKPYDLTADIYSQVYGGRTGEKYRTNRAVDLTKGKVLIYDGKIFPAYYHATCGGFTEDAGNLWKIDLPPLKGVECGFCKRSKHFNWKRNVKLKDIEGALSGAGFKVSGITDIKIESRNRSNRINSLKIAAASGDMTIPGKDFRIIIGPNLLRSNNYETSIDGATAVFKGIGWGHGVGMCQWGAYFMSRKGYKAEQILQYYYPGAEIK